MDKSLTLAQHLERIIKKASSRTNLLSCIRYNINTSTTETIYKLMNLPVMLYCSTSFIDVSESRKQRFENIQNRDLKVVNGQRNSVKLPRVNYVRNRNCEIEVFKCVNGLAPSVYDDYFQRISHNEYA